MKQYLGTCYVHKWMVMIRLHRKFTDSRLKGRAGHLWGAPPISCVILLLVPHDHVSAGSHCGVTAPLAYSSVVSLTILEEQTPLLSRDNLHAQKAPCFRCSVWEFQQLTAAELSKWLASHFEEGQFLSNFPNTWSRKLYPSEFFSRKKIILISVLEEVDLSSLEICR